MRKSWAALALAAFLVAALAMSALAQEQVTLRIAWWGSQDRHDRTLAVIELFEQKYPHIKIEAEFAGWADYWDRIATQAAGRNLPDIFQQDMQYIDLYSSRGMLADLMPYVESGALDTTYISDSELSGGIINGRLYGINLGSNALVGLHDPEIFARAGVEPPGPEWTWDDFVTIGEIIRERTGVYFAGGLPGGHIFHTFQHVLRQRGLSLYGADGRSLGYTDDSLLAELLALELDLVKRGIVAPPAVREEVTSIEDELVVKGQAATAWHWSNAIVAMTAAAGRPLGLITPPKDANQVKEGLYIKPSMFFSVAETSPHKDEAVLFLDFFINDIEANKILFAERGVPISSRVREALEPMLTPAQAQMFEYLALAAEHSSAIDPPEPPGHAEVLAILEDVQSMVLHGELTPEAAARQFRMDATRALRR